MRIALVLVVALACACRPAQSLRAWGDCGLPLDADNRERIATVARASAEPILTWQRTLGTKPIEAGRFYAVVDDDGFVGTMQALRPNNRCAILAMIGSCDGFREWDARWLEEPTRRWGAVDRWHGNLAFGPVNARYVGARRVVPLTPTDLDDDNMPVPAPPRADTTTWTRLVAITTEADPPRIDVWGRRCANDSASVRELRIGDRVVHRAIVRDAEQRRYLD